MLHKYSVNGSRQMQPRLNRPRVGRTNFRVGAGMLPKEGRRPPIPTKEESPQDFIQVVQTDLAFIDSKGVPVTQLLKSVAETHNQVAEVLNPTIKTRRLEDEIRLLQTELERAHEKTHESESRLASTLADIERLEHVSRSFSGPVSSSSPIVLEPKAPATIPAPSSDRTASGAAASAPAARVAAPAPAPSRGAAAVGRRRVRGSLHIPQQLRNHWFPIEFSASLKADMLKPVEIFNEHWVLWRDKEGQAACVRDSCAHRACPLSLGSVKDGQVTCAYHGWKHDRTGAVTEMPSTHHCSGVSIESLRVQERDGFVWIWTGAGEPDKEPADVTPPKGYTVHTELVLEVPVEHGLMIENLLDLAHAPFTHTETFAKGWPVPDLVKFHADKALSGFWHPYPIDMGFRPPCMTVSHIGLAQPGKVASGARAVDCKTHLWQLHVCLPSGDGKCRVLYRMAMDFMPWLRWVPGIRALWTDVANKVMGEDLRLVLGQQENMRRGADVWKTPVTYDAIGVRYRRWRNALEEDDHAERKEMEAALAKPTPAGDLFCVVEGQDTRL